MRIHILGICGTFMAGIAVLAKQLGYTVSGSDEHVYPPMSTQLENLGISLQSGYRPEHLHPAPDCVVIGNAMSRGNPAVEYVLEQNIPYVSGPEWLARNVLADRWVLAVAGTHGKTTTSSILTWILEYAGLNPGFLIGGVPENFGVSARLGQAPFFVIEADEYDTAFFDKRSKFIHYHPRTAILNNLEFDHADIFPNLAAIQQQFQFFVRTIPGNGLIIHPQQDENLAAVLQKGCWTPTTQFALDNAFWSTQIKHEDGSQFEVIRQGVNEGEVNWSLLGKHNVCNALAAIAAAQHAGVPVKTSLAALAEFKNVKRRLELKANVNGVAIYDDFAHHPTAIAVTLDALRKHVGAAARIFVILEFSSYTMRKGVLKDDLAGSLQHASRVFFARPQGETWDLQAVERAMNVPVNTLDTVDAIVSQVKSEAHAGDHILVLCKSGFGNIHQKLVQALSESAAVV